MEPTNTSQLCDKWTLCPNEIIREICKSVSPFKCLELMSLSKKFYESLQDDNFWENKLNGIIILDSQLGISNLFQFICKASYEYHAIRNCLLESKDWTSSTYDSPLQKFLRVYKPIFMGQIEMVKKLCSQGEGLIPYVDKKLLVDRSVMLELCDVKGLLEHAAFHIRVDAKFNGLSLLIHGVGLDHFKKRFCCDYLNGEQKALCIQQIKQNIEKDTAAFLMMPAPMSEYDVD